MRLDRRLLLCLVVLQCSTVVLAAVKTTSYSARRVPWTVVSRGGGHNKANQETEEPKKNTTSTLESYVAAMEEKDDAWQHGDTPKQEADATTSSSGSSHERAEAEDSSAVLGIKAHKKSNAVGDPDSDSDDDSDDSDVSSEEWQDLDDFLPTPHQVQVQVELVSPEQTTTDAPSKNTGGGGVKLGRRGSKKRSSSSSKTASMWNAWLPHIYMPPSSASLSQNTVDAPALNRLDRRTLYAGLLLEWQQQQQSTSTDSATTSRRKFLDSATSQSLQAALSLATQPQWRQAIPQTSSGILLYGDSNNEQDTTTTTTLSMQETIAMALAHSLGCGMVILDDDILASVKRKFKDDVKPGVLLESLLGTAKSNKISDTKTNDDAHISQLMETDLRNGLDDPFDERALESLAKMKSWEEQDDATSSSAEPPLPLVVFVRTEASPNLLKSKSAMEYLMQECSSSDSIHLLVLGKGIDAKTQHLPPEAVPSQEAAAHLQQASPPQDQRGPPWFGFSPQNQNASGQNDPEGSKRFNIFLARTMDANGNSGILGAIAPPQAGNLFPHMMAMQARERMQQQQSGEGDLSSSPVQAELERWAQLLQQQMQNGGPPPQFFNASLAAQQQQQQQSMPPPEVVQQALQQAMTELLDRLAQVNEDETDSELHKAFSQIIQNENLRRGIAENLARAAPALSDPKCQGVMLSVYVPPPPHHVNRGKLPSSNKPWFQKILHPNEDDGDEMDEDEDRKDRVRTVAAAAMVQQDGKVERNLQKLESVCRPITIRAPSDPVRAKSWEGWIARERGSVIFRNNRRALHEELAVRKLSLEQHTGTHGAGSALRQMLSVRDITDDMEDVVKCAVELEAAKSRRQQESGAETLEKDLSLDVDLSLSQLLLTDDGRVEEKTESVAVTKKRRKSDVKLLHPSSLETALSLTCRISPSPAGGLSLSTTPASHRSREDIAALAQDKHERALISQVVSPQDIGVTYDMIGGLSDVKELLRQSITYPLKFPHLYSEGIAREAVKGVLLFGPPGTGKTMLAKAVATEGGASFLSVDASSVENKWLGESEKNAKAVFTLARRLAPCVIFIDEVDSLLSSREGSSDDSAHGTLTSVKTTMMSEWDGLNSGTNGLGEAGSDRVIVIGSTNRPFDLDEAVLRRFPRRILVDLPDMETRQEILEVTLAENRLDPSVNLTQIAERLEGYTGSDIKEVCREAVVQISHEQARLLDQGGLGNFGEDVTQGMLQRLRPVTMEDFEKALNKLKRSVSEKGRELARVWEWNDEYGEIKKDNKNHLPQLMNMYL